MHAVFDPKQPPPAVRLDAHKLLGPFFGFFDDQFFELGRRASRNRTASQKSAI
jgi:hypothetical protein